MIFSKLVRCPHCNHVSPSCGIVIYLRPVKVDFECEVCHKKHTETIKEVSIHSLYLVESEKCKNDENDKNN